MSGGVADMIEAMKAVGIDDALALAAIAKMDELRREKVREAARIRQQNHRSRNAVTRDECDVRDDCDIPPPKNVPHTPYKTTPPNPSLRSGISFEREHAEFLDWAWRTIPKRRGDSPKPFRKALVAALRNGASPDQIRAGLLAYATAEQTGDPQFRKGAAVWVNAAGWEADYSQPSGRFARAGPSEKPALKGGIGALTAKLHGFGNGQRNGTENEVGSQALRLLPVACEPPGITDCGDAGRLCDDAAPEARQSRFGGL